MRIFALFSLVLCGCVSRYQFPPTFTLQYPIEQIAVDRWLDQVTVANSIKLGVEFAANELAVCPPRMTVLFQERLNGVIEFLDASSFSIEVPLIGGKVNSFHARDAMFAAVHEFVEMTLVSPELRGASLYGRDLNNRWIGDGLANFIATEALRKIGSPEPRRSQQLQVLGAASRAGIDSVSIDTWSAHLTDSVEYADGPLCYAASEFVVGSWVKQCRREGIEHPAAALLHWLQSHPNPEQHEVRGWMESAADVRLDLVDAKITLRQIQGYFLEHGS